MQKPRYEKVPTYGRPHDIYYSWLANIYSSKNTTIIPITHSDEGLGAASSYNAHPEHASFAEVGHSNTFVGSRVPKLNSVLKLKLTGQARVAGKNQNIRMLLIKIVNPFMEQLDAEDEHSGLKLKELLELQYESTDKQTYPVYNATNLSSRTSGLVTTDAAEPGIGGTELEQVDADFDALFDQLHYGTLAPLIRSMCKFRWVELSGEHPVKYIPIHQPKSAIAQGKYAAHHLAVWIPATTSKHQHGYTADMSSTNHVEVDFKARYIERNHYFDMEPF
jgi:hypothetical protein